LNVSFQGVLFCERRNYAEKKRLLLANALIGNPSVLILDEPTENLPPDDVALVKEVIGMLGERKTVLIFTEKLSLANDMAKHIGIMANGKMELWSSFENIKQKLDNDPNALLKTFMAFSDGNAGGEN
jgi:ABC-type multidrug transport system ATPase subunit